MTPSDKPILWHIPASHYNEKARWALAWKGIEHERRATLPGLHMAKAMALTRGRVNTFPVLRYGGKTIGDSTAIIAALEAAQPDPPLYPIDPDDRKRALEIEEHFDEVVAPQVRFLVWHEMTRDPERLAIVMGGSLPRGLRSSRHAVAAAAGYGSRFLQARFGVKDRQRAQEARDAVRAAFDLLESYLDTTAPSDYLVADTFTVADLTVASILYPIVYPPEGPQPLADPPRSLLDFQATLSDRPGFAWVERMFATHRKPSV